MQGLAFLKEFTPPGQLPAPAGVPSPEEHETLCAEAYARGLEEGEARAKAAADTETRDALRETAARLEDLSALRAEIAVEVSAEAGAALGAAIRVLAPSLAEQGLVDGARALLENELRDAPRPLALTAAPGVAARLETLAADLPEMPFAVEADEAMPPTRIEAAWPQGSAALDLAALAARLLDLAAGFGPPPDAAPDPVPDPVEDTDDD